MKRSLTFLIITVFVLVLATPSFAFLDKEFYVGKVIDVNPSKKELVISTKDGDQKAFVVEDVTLGKLWKGKEVLITSAKDSNVANSVMLTKYGG